MDWMVGVSIIQEDHKGKDQGGTGGAGEECRVFMDLESRFQFGGFSRIAQDKWHSC